MWIQRSVVTGLVVLAAFAAGVLAQAPTAKVYKRSTSASTYHLADCPFVKAQNYTMVEVPYDDLSASDLTPCSVCHPEKDAAVLAAMDAATGRRLAAADRAKAAERARAATAAAATKAKADAERARLATAPVARASQAQAQAIAERAAATAGNDEAKFTAAFRAGLAAVAPEYRGLLPVYSNNGLAIVATGPVAELELAAKERVRKFQPLGALLWTTGVTISVIPSTITAPDIERLVLQRAGVQIAPISTSLVPKELVTRMGAKASLHTGDVVFPLSAFAPGVTVTLTAIPAAGSNIIKTFTDRELRSIH